MLFDPELELGRDLCAVHILLLPEFHHPMFNRSAVIMLTNKKKQNVYVHLISLTPSV